MSRSQDIRNNLREAFAAAHQSRHGHKTISKLEFNIVRMMVRKINHRWKAFKTDASLSTSGLLCKFTPRIDHAMLKEMQKNLRATSQTQQVTQRMQNVKVDDSPWEGVLNKYSYFLEELSWESLLRLKRNGRHNCGWQSCIWTNHKTSGQIALGQMRPKWSYFPWCWVFQ